MIDLCGKRFGRLIVIEKMINDSNGRSKWLCRCDCKHEKIIRGDSLKSGKTKSCGCLNKEIKTKHNRYHSKTYRSWRSMIQRCTNPNYEHYKNYGSLGIIVCVRWRKFINFLKDMGERPPGLTLDRIKNDQGYCQSNCR